MNCRLDASVLAQPVLDCQNTIRCGIASANPLQAAKIWTDTDFPAAGLHNLNSENVPCHPAGNAARPAMAQAVAEALVAVVAIASSIKDRPVDRDTVCIGELGLSGELRTTNSIQQRINEIARMGFRRCILPARAVQGISIPENLHLVRVSNIYDAIEAALV